MAEALELWEKPKAQRVTMIAGWRQWADAGSVSSGLPEYLIQQAHARPIGRIRSDGFFLFQVPGTHDLVRPVVKYEEGYPVSLELPRADIYYAGDETQGTVFFLGDEPHLDMERYAAAFLQAARDLNVQRIVGLGGVYGEMPYDKERMISASYSLPQLKQEIARLAVTLSNYEGGASIDSYICKRAGEAGMEYVSLYAFVPAYNLSEMLSNADGIRIENDFVAWHGIMRRINYMLKTHFDLSDLERRSRQVVQLMATKIAELDRSNPELGLQDYLAQMSEEFTEVTFSPLGELWEDELERLLDDDEEEGDSPT